MILDTELTSQRIEALECLLRMLIDLSPTEIHHILKTNKALPQIINKILDVFIKKEGHSSHKAIEV